MGKGTHAESDPAAPAAIAAAIDLGLYALPIERHEQSAQGAKLQIAGEDGAEHLRLRGHDFELLVDAAIAERNRSAQRPLRLEAAILSRTRSPITSRSNWAKESSTFSVSRPMLDVVLNDWASQASRWASSELKFEIEIVLGRFAGADRAALGLGNDGLHGLRSPSPTRELGAAPAGCDLTARIRRRLLFGAGDTLAASDEVLGSAPLRSPKKRSPFQLVPVMARAIMERLA